MPKFESHNVQHGWQPMLRRTRGINATLRAGPPRHDRLIFAVLRTLYLVSPAQLPRPVIWPRLAVRSKKE